MNARWKRILSCFLNTSVILGGRAREAKPPLSKLSPSTTFDILGMLTGSTEYVWPCSISCIQHFLINNGQ